MRLSPLLLTLALLSSSVSAYSFGLMSLRSGSNIQFATINAQNTRFWIGKPTMSYCPIDPSDCPAGNQTLLAGGDALGMDVEVPGGQQVYIGPKGALRYTQAHSTYMPSGSIMTGFTLTSVNSSLYEILDHDGGFYACPLGKRARKYQIYVGVGGFSKKNCLGFVAAAINVTGIGAWQYT